MLENLALRQQLSTVLQKRWPRIGPVERAFWVVLRRVWAEWSDAVVIVKPETVIGWHRAGFALYWRWLSRRRRSPGRVAVGREIRDLVRKMAAENGWGAPRIHGELLKLGFRVSERTVSRYLRTVRRRPGARQSWLTFLRNHREVIVALFHGGDSDLPRPVRLVRDQGFPAGDRALERHGKSHGTVGGAGPLLARRSPRVSGACSCNQRGGGPSGVVRLLRRFGSRSCGRSAGVTDRRSAYGTGR